MPAAARCYDGACCRDVCAARADHARASALRRLRALLFYAAAEMSTPMSLFDATPLLIDAYALWLCALI